MVELSQSSMSTFNRLGAIAPGEHRTPRRGLGAAAWVMAGTVMLFVAALYVGLPAESVDRSERDALATLRLAVVEMLVHLADRDVLTAGAETLTLDRIQAVEQALAVPLPPTVSENALHAAWNTGAKPALRRIADAAGLDADRHPLRGSAGPSEDATHHLLGMLLTIERADAALERQDPPVASLPIYALTGFCILAAAALIITARYPGVILHRHRTVAGVAASPAAEPGAEQPAIRAGIAQEVLRSVLDEPESDEPFRDLLREIEAAFAGSAAALIATNADGKPVEVLARTGVAGKAGHQLFAGDVSRLRKIDGSETLSWIVDDSDSEEAAVAATLALQGETLGLLMVRSPLFSAPPVKWQNRLRRAADEVSGIVSAAQRARLSRRLVISEERAAIARELHDSLAQSLSYLKIQASRLQKLLDGRTPTTNLDRLELDTIVDEFRNNLTLAYRQLRELITTCRLTMNGRDLGQALEDSVDEFGRRSAVTIDLDNRIEKVRLPVDQELQVLHIVREALSNIVRHSHAKRAIVTLRPGENQDLELEIFDDGIGMDLRKRQEQHYGLVIMQERARNLGGAMRLDTPADGGTRISVIFSRGTSPTPSAIG
jgi:two-component system nitrate/nitrite sensor histidine kinase NarX